MPIKIIDLASITVPALDDLLIIRDTETGTTRKITREDFFTDPPLPEGSVVESMIAPNSIGKTQLKADAKFTPRVNSITNTATLTFDVDSYEIVVVTAQSQAITIASPTGTPVHGQAILIRLRDNGTARAITWNAVFAPVGVTLPTTTTASKVTYVAARWNATQSRWDVLSVGREV